MFSLLLSLESQAISYHLRHFHQGLDCTIMVIEPFLLAGDVRESPAMSSFARSVSEGGAAGGGSKQPVRQQDRMPSHLVAVLGECPL